MKINLYEIDKNILIFPFTLSSKNNVKELTKDLEQLTVQEQIFQSRLMMNDIDDNVKGNNKNVLND